MNKVNTFKIALGYVKDFLLTAVVFLTLFCVLSAKVNSTEASEQLIPNNVESSTTFSAYSVGQLTNKAAKNSSDIISAKRDKTISKILGKTRTEHLLIKGEKNRNLNQQVDPLISKNADIYDFGIYRAFTYLLEDIDEDGFYQSFSVIFDADVYSSYYAEVYAELYLRKDGGPWIHYYSSDIFSLSGESEEDEFEVNTTLEQGFTTGHYDVLIDLYEANSNQLVVSYSSDDSNALYALALESSDYDPLYVTDVEVIYSEGGSLSLLMLLISLIVASYRYKQ